MTNPKHRAQVFARLGGGWCYHVRAMNGEVIDQSEGYTRRFSAVRAVKRNTDAGVIEVFSNRGVLVRTIRR